MSNIIHSYSLPWNKGRIENKKIKQRWSPFYLTETMLRYIHESRKTKTKESDQRSKRNHYTLSTPFEDIQYVSPRPILFLKNPEQKERWNMGNGGKWSNRKGRKIPCLAT